MKFISNQAKKYELTPVVTFDQPLDWKAMTNIKSADQSDNVSKIILRLEGFHTVTSFLGSIGHVMNGSGLRQVMDLIYAEETVPHLLSGKAISRGIRAHFFIDSALHILLLKNMFHNENNDDEVLFTSLNIQEKLERLKFIETTDYN